MEDEPQPLVLALELPDDDVVGRHRAGQRLQVADRPGLAQRRRVADDADPVGRQLGEAGHHEIAEAR